MAEQDDEFQELIIDDDDGPSNRPFLLAAGGLIGLLLITLICFGTYQTFFAGDGADDPTSQPADAVANNELSMTATSIVATNEAIATINGGVTQTVESMRLTEEAPTNTPTPTATSTNTPTATPTNTPTPVIQEGELTPENAETAEANIAATSIFSGENTVTPESGSIAGSGNDNGAVAAADTNADNRSSSSADNAGSQIDDERLPETGVPVTSAIAIALGLFLLFVIARRLRAN